MRRNYISPEFSYKQVYGTFNMLEKSNFLGKMLEVEDSLELNNQVITYYESLVHEQIDFVIESLSQPISYSLQIDLKNNHTLIIDESQSISQKDTTTKYILTIDLKTILRNYLFAIIKNARTFEGVSNIMTKSKSVDFAIKDYIDKNILNRYELDKIELYINYIKLNNTNVLKYDNVFAGSVSEQTQNRVITQVSEIVNDEFKLTKMQIETSFDQSSTSIRFSQDKKSNEFCFDYYFKLFYKRV